MEVIGQVTSQVTEGVHLVTGAVTSARIGNQKLVSVDSIALFGLIGLLAAIGAILTHKFQVDETDYLHTFQPGRFMVLNMERNDTCDDPAVECVNGYTLDLLVNCTATDDATSGLINICGPASTASDFTLNLDFDDFKSWNATVVTYLKDLDNFNMNHGENDTAPATLVPGFYSSNSFDDFNLFEEPDCEGWCSNTDWMFTLCIAVAGLCVGFSALVFLYLYLGAILTKLYPERVQRRLAALLLMQGEEPPNLDRPTTASKSESIKPDLKEY